jgi:hypothetical protein
LELTAIAINCSLKRSGAEPSSTDAMIQLIGRELAAHRVQLTDSIRIADSQRAARRQLR